MSAASTRPVIFISYAHADEPEKPSEGEVQWLSFVRRFLQPAVKNGIFGLWVDRKMMGGADWDPEIEQKLRACDIFILLVSDRSMASEYIVDKEIAIIRERQAKGDDVYFYPLLLTPTPDEGLNKVKDKNLRPRDAKPFSSFPYHDRLQHMSDAADEIARIAQQIAERKGALRPSPPSVRRADVHISGLPETAYERLVGRDADLQRLDDAWADAKTNILSLVAEGGAGKSALVNEWLKLLQADIYRGADAVLGWSFYSQGTKERATSAEEFLSWALDKLGIKLATTSATAKAEAIAETMMRRRVLLLLDGVEPLQHGLDAQLGQLKDQGLRALLRRFAATPPGKAHGLIVLTSRLAVKDIARWEGGAAVVVDIELLSDEAGAALLHDNGVWGADKELKTAAHDFGGHPLALGLLAGFLKETQTGDVRQRDRIRAFLADRDNPRHDHAKRVMESYEKEWLTGHPALLAIMHMVGLFDRPASRKCLFALRKPPVIQGLTDSIINLDDKKWQRAIVRLREVRLLSPRDPSAPDELDAHPLVREWFGERLRETNEAAWKTAHGRLYEHLRDTTREGKTPTLEDLAPLYQAVAHGCRAGRYQEALEKIFMSRISRLIPEEFEFYSTKVLGASGSDLAAMSWFFETPYESPNATLSEIARRFVLGQAAYALRAQGRLTEALPVDRVSLLASEESRDWLNCAIAASNVAASELLVGEIASAISTGFRSIEFADRAGEQRQSAFRRAVFSEVLHAAGRRTEAEELLVDAEKRQRRFQPEYPLLYSIQGYQYCDLLLAKAEWKKVRDRAKKTFEWGQQEYALLGTSLDLLALGRAHFGMALTHVRNQDAVPCNSDVNDARTEIDASIDKLRAAGTTHHLPRGLLARAAFRRSVGDWGGAARDLDEILEIAEPGPMRLFLCDMALQRARLALAHSEAFAPLNELIDDSPPKPEPPSEAEWKSLHDEAGKQLAIAADYIEKCGYHRRDEEIAELQTVLRGEHRFADLPPRV
jgi:TIR domain/AAA ATPase domain